ncbi:MAG: glycoside hydrolase, partial [Tannerellaceae bacterium]|nr:glycoside hydrolase [Tannerellaceae bacterium]
MKTMKMKVLPLCLTALLGGIGMSCSQPSSTGAKGLTLNDSSYFETRGLNVMVFSNLYDNMFDDSKISGVEIIHHGVRTVTNGDVRLNPTPGQWDPIPQYVDRKIDKENQRIEAILKYPTYDFQYSIVGEVRDGGFYLSVQLDQPLPESLSGIAGLNLEFVPAAYFGKSYIADERYGLFPSYPSDKMTTINGETEPTPFATAQQFVFAPDDPSRHITVKSVDGNPLLLFDGRNKAQNGWFVLRSLLPAGKSGKVAEWLITAETIAGWTRKPVIAHSQVGYLPVQPKKAVVELDKNDKPLSSIRLLKIKADGSSQSVLSGKPQVWGDYQRYHY